MLQLLNYLSIQVNDSTELTMNASNHFLYYCYDHLDTLKLYKSSDIILTLYVGFDATYLVKPKAKIRSGWFFYLSNKDVNVINGSILIVDKIMEFVMTSTAEVEIAALFMNAKLAMPIWRALIERAAHNLLGRQKWITAQLMA